MSTQAMDREKAMALVRVLANKLVALAGVENKDDAWRAEWKKNFDLFRETVESIEDSKVSGNVCYIEDYRHRSIDFGNGNFAINTTVNNDSVWLFINPRAKGHQWFYGSLDDMLNSIYVYSNVFVFADDMLVLDGDGRAKWLKPLWYEPMVVKPVDGKAPIIEKVNRLIELNNRFLCMHPFTVVSGCYELAWVLSKETDELVIARYPFDGSPMAITDIDELRRLMWDSLRQAYPYDLCGDAYCYYTFVVDDLRAILILLRRYPANHSLADLDVRLYEYRLKVSDR